MTENRISFFIFVKCFFKYISFILSLQKIVFIINPKAGSKRHSQLELLDSDEFIIEYTHYKFHATEICNNYLKKGHKHFVAIGGDGTVNEIASQLVSSDALLSIIPVGSGNGLARSLNIPLNINQALDKIKNHKIIRIDAGQINDKTFFCTAGIGFDALCAEKFDKEKHSRGLWNYIKITLKNYFSFDGQEVSLNNQNKKVFSMTFANANQFGNNAFIAPDAKLNDGYLDCSIINKHPKIMGFWLAYLLMNKKIRSSKYNEYYRGENFEVKVENNGLIHVDGESVLLNSNIIKVGIIKNCLSITI